MANQSENNALGKRVYGADVCTPPGRAQFVHLVQPDTTFVKPGQEAKRKLHLLIDKSTDLSGMFKAVLDTAQAHARENSLPVPNDLSEVTHPFRDGDSKAEKNYEGFANSWFIIPTTKQIPTCLGPDGATIIEASSVYPGALIRCYLTPASYTQNLQVQEGMTMETIKRPAVSFYLVLVQFLQDLPRFMSKPSLNPTDVFSSWSQGEAPTAFASPATVQAAAVGIAPPPTAPAQGTETQSVNRLAALL